MNKPAPSPHQREPRTTHERTMTLFQVAITQTPSALAAQAGETDKLILAPTDQLANSANHAVAQVVFNNSTKLAGVDLARCTVLTVKRNFDA